MKSTTAHAYVYQKLYILAVHYLWHILWIMVPVTICVMSCRKHITVNEKNIFLWLRIHILCHEAILCEAFLLWQIMHTVNHDEWESWQSNSWRFLTNLLSKAANPPMLFFQLKCFWAAICPSFLPPNFVWFNSYLWKVFDKPHRFWIYMHYPYCMHYLYWHVQCTGVPHRCSSTAVLLQTLLTSLSLRFIIMKWSSILHWHASKELCKSFTFSQLRSWRNGRY